MASMRPRPDAAENPSRPAALPHGSARFNEAAARCRGKPSPSRRMLVYGRSFNEAAARCRGKRPTRSFKRYGASASMRPRPDAAENAATTSLVSSAPARASMRPRPDAAENRAARTRTAGSCGRFNEAAARCRGKRTLLLLLVAELMASMRPRPDAAENDGGLSGQPSPYPLQ